MKIREFEKSVIVDLPDRVVKGNQDEKLRALLVELVKGGKNIGVNFAHSQFVDSSIVTLLLMAEKLMRSGSARLFILCPPDQARELFTITSVNRIIPVLDSEKEFLLK